MNKKIIFLGMSSTTIQTKFGNIALCQEDFQFASVSTNMTAFKHEEDTTCQLN